MATTSSPTRPATTVTPALAEVIADIGKVVRLGYGPEPTARRVARVIKPALGRADLLTPPQREGDSLSYRQHVLHAEPDGGFSVVALVWLPGQRTVVHDHVSWCVTGVYVGCESERRYRLVPSGLGAHLVPVADLLNPAGSVAAFAPPGDIHRVHNACSAEAISIHVYGADIRRLGTSIRRTYPDPMEDATCR
jgi:predicted metal-dependent enzyme (double-stranded beta helix superfamily)